jgi:hypothetical protein
LSVSSSTIGQIRSLIRREGWAVLPVFFEGHAAVAAFSN